MVVTKSSSYYYDEIERIEDLIEKYKTMVPNTKVKNGQNEMTAGNATEHYMTVKAYYERQYEQALKSEGKIPSRVRILRFDMGEGC